MSHMDDTTWQVGYDAGYTQGVLDGRKEYFARGFAEGKVAGKVAGMAVIRNVVEKDHWLFFWIGLASGGLIALGLSLVTDWFIRVMP